jgi:hypothetical protein
MNQAQHSAKGVNHMKSIINTFLAFTICAGLILAGAETGNLTTQMFASGGGVMLFVAGAIGLCIVHGEE